MDTAGRRPAGQRRPLAGAVAVKSVPHVGGRPAPPRPVGDKILEAKRPEHLRPKDSMGRFFDFFKNLNYNLNVLKRENAS